MKTNEEEDFKNEKDENSKRLGFSYKSSVYTNGDSDESSAIIVIISNEVFIEKTEGC